MTFLVSLSLSQGSAMMLSPELRKAELGMFTYLQVEPVTSAVVTRVPKISALNLEALWWALG